jgi:hypothetical protein
MHLPSFTQLSTPFSLLTCLYSSYWNSRYHCAQSGAGEGNSALCGSE